MGSGADKVKELLQTARKQIQNGERREALITYRKALNLDPDNQQIIARIDIIEREISAMDKFNQSRSTRVHSAGRNISSSGFVDECIQRSDEAFEAGDDVRALQELERAKRHDPDNMLIEKKIRYVKRSMKVIGLADLVRTSLKSGDPSFAVENIRIIFDTWASAPVLGELIDLIGSYEEAPVTVEKKPEPVVPAEVKVEKEEVEKPEEVITPPPPVPPKKKPEKVARPKKEPKPKKVPKPEKEPRKKIGKKEKKKEKKPVPVPVPDKLGKNKLYLIIGAVVFLAIVIFAVIKLTCKAEPEVEIIEYIPPQSFTETVVILGAENVELILDGNAVQEVSPGVFILSDTLFIERIIHVSAEGFETLTWNPRFTEGQVSTDTMTLDSIGTSMLQVTFNYTMPEGEEDPGLEAVSFMIDGELIEGNTDSILTGLHVFQAALEGYRTMPDSVLVAKPEDLVQNINILASEQAQITLQLSTDTPGNANFFIDGSRVATGRRMTEVLPFGSYFLQVQMDGREDWGVSINLDQEGYSRTVALTEAVLIGQLMVGPEPWSDVYVDGSHVGTTPFGGVELEPGTYTVRLSNPDFEDDVHTIEIVADETTAIQYNAVPITEEVEEIEEVPEEALPISSPFAIQQTAPVVPSLASARGDLHGYVTLAVRVGADGSVQNVSIVNDPLGLGCGQAAVDAVRTWVFSPAMQGDQPVEVTTNVQVRFDIE